MGALVAKNSNTTSWHKLLHQFRPFCTEFRKSTKQSQMHQNCTNAPKHEFSVQWGGSGVFIAKKFPTRLRGTNFCTSSARFASSFVSQPNSPKCTKIVRTHQNMGLGSNGEDRVRSMRKIPMRLYGTNLCINCTSSTRFAPSFM